MIEYGFHPDASLEYSEAVLYYNDINPRVAEGFISEIESSLLAIRRNPQTWRMVEDDVRRYLVHRFPYGIYYTYEYDFVTIWAMAHLSREPRYWQARMG